MTDLEDRIRRDLKKFADLPDPELIRSRLALHVRGPSRPRFWLAPAAAVVAVFAMIAGASLGGAHSPGNGTSLSARARVAARELPPFYVAFVRRITGNDTQVHATAVVHDSATGAALATVAVPTLASGAYSDGPDITAAADDRKFVITELGDTGPANHLARFYLLRLAANGRSASLARLAISVPRSLAVADVALSPDSTRLAMQEQSCYRHGCYYTGIRVGTIATGAVRTWTTPAKGAPFALSWAGNSTVAFLWGSRYRLLDGDCNVLSLAPAGTNVLVSCFTFGRVDNNSFTPLPGFPSGSSSGIGGQHEGAW